jgi:hypothetical protein
VDSSVSLMVATRAGSVTERRSYLQSSKLIEFDSRAQRESARSCMPAWQPSDRFAFGARASRRPWAQRRQNGAMVQEYA